MQKYLIYAGIAVLGAILLWCLARWVLKKAKRALWLRAHQDEEMVAVMMEGRIARGMTIEMVLDVWGQPADLDETVLKTKSKQEMKYDQKGKNRFGTRVHLENGLVVGWETK